MSMISFGNVESQSGDVPLARFGHTTTYIGQQTVIMFGGAVGDSGRYQITNDTYILDLTTIKWTLVTLENAPAARAAHAAACVDEMQYVIFGGATGGGSLSSDELYLLDWKRQSNLHWMPVPIEGQTPGRRYGHTMVFHKPNLIVFGGNDGQRTVNDIWFMNVEQPPFFWTMVQLPPSSKQPPARVYHSADICREGPAHGMMVVFGGRTSDSKSLKDAWGLRQHRDGRWDWVDAPNKRAVTPDARFQHTALFFGSRMLIVGGRDGEVARALPTSLYDTEACEWRILPPIGRFRHSSWCFDNLLFTFGGFDHRTQSHPTSDLQSVDITNQPNFFSEKERDQLRRRVANPAALPNSPGGGNYSPGGPSSNSPPPDNDFRSSSPPQPVTRTPQPTKPSTMGPRPSHQPEKVKIANHVITKVDSPHNPDFSTLVRKISIDRLEEEGRKIKGFAGVHSSHMKPDSDLENSLADRVIRKLLRPNVTPMVMERDFNSLGPFCLSWEEVSQLCMAVLHIVRREETVLKLRAPIKVYGDIHGQFYDMMRLFGSYKAPVGEDWATENDIPPDADVHGDVDSNDYLFLGDFVDRGTNSLEVIALLFALKAKYPRQVHLIRGNHEDSSINCIYGFKEECKRRLREDPDHSDSCWEKFNRVFEYLPVGALIEERILCIHGGIGGSIHEVDHIRELRRPLKVAQVPTNELEQRVTDLLWSDPTDNDSLRGVMPNDTRDPDGSGHIVKFGPDRVLQFLQDNKLDLIIRAHECVMDGFERFAGGKLITLFSATDYCGHHKNAGALLFIRRDLTVVPKIIYPPDRETSSHLRSTWIALDSRPPTPPRSTRRLKDPDLEI